MKKYEIITDAFIPEVGEFLADLHDKNDDTEVTKAKEQWAENVLRENRIFELVAQEVGIDYLGRKKITNKKLQKSGIDYVLFGENKEINVDLKTGIGSDYSMRDEDWTIYPEKIIKEICDDKSLYVGHDGIAVEITQYDFFTNRKEKATDYDLYIQWDCSGIKVYLIDYKEINRVSNENWWHFEKCGHSTYLKVRGSTKYGPDKAFYALKTSFNGTGVYIKYPVEKIATACWEIKNNLI